MNGESPKAFVEFVKEYSSQRRKFAPLRNVTFFMGAGFSKSWDDKYPSGDQLFTVRSDDSPRKPPRLWEFMRTLGYDPSTDIDSGLFRDITYHLNMYKRYPSLRPRYIDDTNIEIVEKELSSHVLRCFLDMAPVYYFEESILKLQVPLDLTPEQQDILDFLRFVFDQCDGSRGIPEGLRPNFITTNYDSLIECLLDEIVGEDDSIFLYLYRGVTPTTICGCAPPGAVHEHWLVHSLFKVNGGFEIRQDGNHFRFDYREEAYETHEEDPPVLMLPSRYQDYSHSYFQAVFPKAVRLLQETTILVIVGYSMPEDDALLRFLLRQFAEDPGDAVEKLVFYVDSCSESKQTGKLESIFPYLKTMKWLQCFPYSGTFQEWAKAVLAAAPHS